MAAALGLLVAVLSLWIGGLFATFVGASLADREPGAAAAATFVALAITITGLIVAARLIGA